MELKGSDARSPGDDPMEEQPIALAVWEQMAELYAARVETKPHNAFYERPATRSLLPPVAGKRVLDAACGPGFLAEWLLDGGAEVVGFDVSSRMVELAEGRLQGRARIVLADLGRPLDFLEADSFDLVVSSLALDYVENWEPVFKEFFRVLHRPGHFVFSAGHPSDEFYDHHDSGNYFDVEQVEIVRRGFGTPITVPYYRRPLSGMLDPLLGAGFTLQRVLEPRPVEEFKELDPNDYRKLMKQPGFICFRAAKL